MKTPKLSFIFRLFDFLLTPFMWILGGFKFPLQETHLWHISKWNWKMAKALVVKGRDKKAKFGHESSFGLLHMPIFGGLAKYAVIQAKGYNKHWFVGWKDQIQKLPIKENKIKLLVGKNGFIAYGLGDNGKHLQLKVVGFGEIGDGKYNGLRLF